MAVRGKETWSHPTETYAFVYNRGGSCVTSINGVKKVIRGLKFIPENKETALKELDARIREKKGISEPLEFSLYLAYKEFIQNYFKKLDKASRPSYKNAILNYIPEDMPLNDVNAIKRVILENMEKPRLNQNGTIKPHEPNTQLMYLSKLNKFFQYCVKNEYIASNPIDRIIRPDKTYKKIVLFTREEVNMMIDYFNDRLNARFYRGGRIITYPLRDVSYEKYFAEFIEFISYSGTRLEETLKIYADESEAPYINGTNLKSYVTPTKIIIDGKRKRYDIPNVREIPLVLIPKLDELVKSIIARNNKPKLFPFVNRGNIQYRMRRVIADLNLNPELNIHSLRKTAIHYWEKELGLSPYIAAYLAGHSIATRQQHYAENPNAEELVFMASK